MLNVAPAGASVSATYACSTSGGSFVSPVTINATAPKAAAPGKPVTLTSVQYKVTVPGSLVTEMENSGITWIAGTVKTLDINATDAKVTTVNVAGKGIAIPMTNLPKPAANVTFHLPAKPVTIGPWVAKAKGTMTFTDGTIADTLTDNLAVTIPVTCTAKPVATLAKTTVS
jgi:hypothetical protein